MIKQKTMVRKVVSHSQFQNYRRNYGMVCLTGLLGCRWTRYKQSTQENSKRDLVCFSILLLTALYITFLFYFLIVSVNDEDTFNHYMYLQTDNWIHLYTVLLAVFSALFAYVILLVLLAVCHMVQGHQVYIHPFHIFVLFLVLAGCAVLTWLISTMWTTEWTILYISLQVIGPFLQIGAVCFMTILSWVIIQQWFKLNTFVWKIVCACVFITLMMGLYISPLFIHSPCVVEAERLPRKPKMFAHRGASAIAPENTVIAFQKAIDIGVYGLETDVTISQDGVPFIMHDTNLRRTSNIDSVYPDLKYQDASMFNMSDLMRLDTGSWFIQKDPMNTVGDLTDTDKMLYRNQTILTFREFLFWAKIHDIEVMFDIKETSSSHPYFNETIPLIRSEINKTGFPPEKVWWLNKTHPGFIDSYRFVSKEAYTVSDLLAANLSTVHVQPSEISETQIREYQTQGVATNIYLVNTRWLYSYYWCLGVESIASNWVHVLSDMSTPAWHMPPNSYLMLWVAVDVTSAIIIIILFVIQRVRLSSSRYTPDVISSHTAGSTWTNYRRRRSMKEKLLMKDVTPDNFDTDQQPDSDYGIESNYEVTLTPADGRALARNYHSNSNRHVTEVEMK